MFSKTQNEGTPTSSHSTDNFYVTSAIAEHAIKTGHTIDWSGAKVVDRNDHFYQRCLLESYIFKEIRML